MSDEIKIGDRVVCGKTKNLRVGIVRVITEKKGQKAYGVYSERVSYKKSMPWLSWGHDSTVFLLNSPEAKERLALAIKNRRTSIEDLHKHEEHIQHNINLLEEILHMIDTGEFNNVDPNE